VTSIIHDIQSPIANTVRLIHPWFILYTGSRTPLCNRKLYSMFFTAVGSSFRSTSQHFLPLNGTASIGRQWAHVMLRHPESK